MSCLRVGGSWLFILCLGLSAAAQDKPAARRPASRPGEAPIASTLDGRAVRTLHFAGKIENLQPAGSGKYFVCRLSDENKLVVIDCAAAKVVKVLSFPSAPLFAAGAEKLFVILPREHIIQRYSLDTLEREVSTHLNLSFVPGMMIMGHASQGPILVGGKGDEGEGSFLDPQTLHEIRVKMPVNNEFEANECARVEADPHGCYFVSVQQFTDSGVDVLFIDGNQVETHKDFSNNTGFYRPSWNGDRIYAMPKGKSQGSTPLSPENPSITGNFNLLAERVDGNDREGAADLLLFRNNSRQYIGLLKRVVKPVPFRGNDKYLINRYSYFPELSTVSIVHTDDEGIDFITVDVDAELKDIDYESFVASTPPGSATAGKAFRYQIVVKSKATPLKYSLTRGPTGAQVDARGLVTWNVPSDWQNSAEIKVQITDSAGAQIEEAFVLHCAPSKIGQASPTPDQIPPAPAITKQATPLPATKLSSERTVIQLPESITAMELGGGGRYLVAWLQSGSQITVVDLCEGKIVGSVPVGMNGQQTAFAVGAEKFVAYLPDKKVLARWDLATLKQEKTVPVKEAVVDMHMGRSSAGPIMVFHGFPQAQPPQIGMKFYDLNTLSNTSFAAQNFDLHGEVGPVSVSADGTSFAIPSNNQRFVYDGRQMNRLRDRGPAERQAPGPFESTPTLDGRFFFQFLYAPNAATQTLVVYPAGNSRPLLALNDFKIRKPGYTSKLSTPVLVMPDAKLLAVITSQHNTMTNHRQDAIELYKFDIDQILANGELDYLYVASPSPDPVQPGAMLEHQLDVKSKRGGVSYQLESGPAGMRISDTGLVTWQVPASDQKSQVAMVKIGDAAKQVEWYTLQVTIAPPAPTPDPASKKRPDRPRPVARKPYAEALGKMRTWTEATTGRTVEATLSAVEADRIVVVLKDGKKTPIPLSRLSEDDLDWLKDAK